eukprot:4568884-Prymnesium_polylepis.1
MSLTPAIAAPGQHAPNAGTKSVHPPAPRSLVRDPSAPSTDRRDRRAHARAPIVGPCGLHPRRGVLPSACVPQRERLQHRRRSYVAAGRSEYPYPFLSLSNNLTWPSSLSISPSVTPMSCLRFARASSFPLDKSPAQRTSKGGELSSSHTPRAGIMVLVRCGNALVRIASMRVARSLLASPCSWASVLRSCGGSPSLGGSFRTPSASSA